MRAEGTLLLDNHEGWATDIAVASDGRLWVAMNVREANVWRPRIALLDATGDFTGIEIHQPGWWGAELTDNRWTSANINVHLEIELDDRATWRLKLHFETEPLASARKAAQ